MVSVRAVTLVLVPRVVVTLMAREQRAMLAAPKPGIAVQQKLTLAKFGPELVVQNQALPTLGSIKIPFRMKEARDCERIFLQEAAPKPFRSAFPFLHAHSRRRDSGSPRSSPRCLNVLI